MRRQARRICCAAMAVLALACGAPPTAPSVPPPSAPAPAPPAPTPEPSQDAALTERLAAIQHAMNQLDEAAQQCWAMAAAVEGYRLAGEIVALVDIAAPRAGVSLTKDGVRSPRLTSCLKELLATYPWAPPLAGQAISLPFAFRAPSGQSVIDRRFVPAVTQGAASVATLLDARNTGNAAASMFELTLAPGATTGLRVASRTEVWAFLSDGVVSSRRGAAQPFAAGDLLLVPAGAERKLDALAGAPLRAAIVMTPGGEEGAARAGALPTPEAPHALPAGSAAPRAFALVRASAAPTYPRPGGAVQLFIDPKATNEPAISAALLTFAAGTAVPLHQHATETELLYILEGGGTMTLGGVSLQVTATSVVAIPPGAPHAFVASSPLRAIQLYTPAGPEQRFKPAAPRP